MRNSQPSENDKSIEFDLPSETLENEIAAFKVNGWEPTKEVYLQGRGATHSEDTIVTVAGTKTVPTSADLQFDVGGDTFRKFGDQMPPEGKWRFRTVYEAVPSPDNPQFETVWSLRETEVAN